jgi:4-amino-4-deoxy-L-arabinose transferase-like glycosyltransferase
MNLLTKEHQNFLLFMSIVAIVRLLLAPMVGLGVDEAHYVLYALNLDLSYFDHPPLVGWVQYISVSLFGANEFGARVPAILIGIISSLSLYSLLYSIEQSAQKSFIATLALHASFIFNALFIMLMPDTLLFALIIPIIFAVIKVERENSLLSWLILGVLLGIAGLSKYTAVLFIVPIIIYVLIKKRYKLFYSIKIIPAVFIALAIISPVIIWNIQNDWISFSYQSNHVVGEASIHWNGFFRSLASQLAAYNPFFVPLAFYGLYKSFRSKNDLLLLSALFGLVLIAFFTYASLYKTALPHWSALFYLLFIPIGAYFLIDSYKKYTYFAIAFGLVVGAVAYLELARFQICPLGDLWMGRYYAKGK